MTAATETATGPAARHALRRLVRAELRKLLTTRLWWGLAVGLVATAAIFAGVSGIAAGRDTGAGVGPGLDDPATVRSVYAAGLSVAYLFALSLGVVTMAGEFRHQTITATLLGSPRRSRVVVAKLVALALAGLAYGVVAVATGVLVGVPVLLARGVSDLRLTSDGVPRALALSVVAVALWAVLGLGVGTLVRNQVVALLVAIGVAWIAEPLLSLALNALDAGSVARFLPTQATTAVVTPPAATGDLTLAYLPWWAGVLVLLGYAAVSGALGAAITLRRDVT